MKRVIRRHHQLRDDIIAIYVYVHARSEQSADKVLAAIERSIRNLIDTPGSGRHWNSPDPRLDGLRVTTVRPYRNYLVFLRAVPDGIEVFRVVHAARELEPLVDDILVDFDDDNDDDSQRDVFP